MALLEVPGLVSLWMGGVALEAMREGGETQFLLSFFDGVVLSWTQRPVCLCRGTTTGHRSTLLEYFP